MQTPLSARFSRNLSLLAFAPLALGVLLIAMGSAMAAPVGEEDATIILRPIDRHPNDPASARRLYARISAAALEVCGGGDHSFAEVNRSIRNSACWRKAMSGALAQVSSPYLPKP
jgi:UrcA family protein